jgi:ribulose-5-phosphate 4-epimerase/fuculose-1-phosphate aldolase
MSERQQSQVPDTRRGEHESAEWHARVDLSAAHRLAAIQEFSEGVFNHFTLMVPGKSDRFLLIPFGLHWSEVQASSLMEVSLEGKILRGHGDIEASAFAIHAPLHRLNHRAKAILHVHPPYISALTRLRDSRLKPVGQLEVQLMNDIAYDDHYPGYSESGERLAPILGDKSILFMANHGVLVIGETMAEAYDRLYYLEHACRVQLFARWAGEDLKSIDPEVIKEMAQSGQSSYLYTNPNPLRRACDVHFDALKRMLERTDGPEYRM